MTAPTPQAPVKTVLLTGFEPFNGAAINPSWEAVRALDGWPGPGFTVVARQLPCVFGAATDAAAQRRRRTQARHRDRRRPGRRPPRDLRWSASPSTSTTRRSADNDGGSRSTRPSWRTDRPRISARCRQGHRARDARARLSGRRLADGRHVRVQPRVLRPDAPHRRGRPCARGFIHVPFLPEQAADRPERPPSMALARHRRRLRIAVEVAAR